MIFLTGADPLLGIEADSTDTPRLKLLPGARYRATTGWTVPATPATVYTLHSLFKPEEITVESDAAEILSGVHNKHSTLMGIRSGHMVKHKKTPDGMELWSHQDTAVFFLEIAKRVLLADEMGVGKTPEALVALTSGAENSHLVVCPNSVKFNWAEEAAKWAPGVEVFVVDGDAPKRRRILAEALSRNWEVLVIINWEAMKLHTRWMSPTNFSIPGPRRDPGELNAFNWTTIVLDEAHRIKNVKAQQTLAAHGLAVGVENRYALTGTPIANDEGDLWPLLKWVDPDQYPDKSRFHKRYLLERPGFFGGMEVEGLNPAHSEELHRILEGTMLRRTKAEVLPFLPEKMHTTLKVPLAPKQAKAYKAFVKDLIVRLEDGGMIAGRSLGEELARMRQLACGMPMVDDDNNVIGLTTPSSKLDEVWDLLEATGDDPLVIYTEHSKFLMLLIDRLRKGNTNHAPVKVGYITGDVPAVARQTVIKAFEGGDVRVFAATCAAAGEGINLTSAARLVFAQLPWSQIHYLQAQDRIHRPGAEKHKHIEIISMVAPGTIETDVLAALADKATRLNNVTQDREKLLDYLRSDHGRQ